MSLGSRVRVEKKEVNGLWGLWRRLWYWERGRTWPEEASLDDFRLGGPPRSAPTLGPLSVLWTWMAMAALTWS